MSNFSAIMQQASAIVRLANQELTEDGRLSLLTAAHASATMAVAEEARTANLIAFAAHLSNPGGGDSPNARTIKQIEAFERDIVRALDLGGLK